MSTMVLLTSFTQLYVVLEKKKQKSLSETHYFYNSQDLSVGKSVEKNSSNEK